MKPYWQLNMVSLFATDYVWDPEWSHPLFIIIPTDISSQAITTVSINRDYVRITPLTIDATPLNYISLFTNRTGNNSLSSIFINEKNLNGTRSLTQQDIQAPSHFIYEEIVETMPTITQQSIQLFILHLHLQRRLNTNTESTIHLQNQRTTQYKSAKQ